MTLGTQISYSNGYIWPSSKAYPNIYIYFNIKEEHISVPSLGKSD